MTFRLSETSSVLFTCITLLTHFPSQASYLQRINVGLLSCRRFICCANQRDDYKTPANIWLNAMLEEHTFLASTGLQVCGMSVFGSLCLLLMLSL